MNHIRTAFRTLKKNKGFTAINVLGLSVGLATCLLIVFYVVDELSYDRYNTKADRIFRVNEDLKLGNNNVQYAVCMPPLAQTLKNDFFYVENAARLKKAGIVHIRKGGAMILESNVVYADQAVFDVFTLPFITGSSSGALNQPNTMVITQSTAKKYFGSTNAIGQVLTFNDNTVYKVTGVISDIPKQSHFKADFLISMSSLSDSQVLQWLRSEYNTYVLLKNTNDAQKLQAAFPAFLRKYSSTEMQTALHLSVDEFEKSGSHFRLNLTPLTAIHLHSDRSGELDHNGNIQYVYIFSAIALFILLIACVNFMNLSTARSSTRAREVGVRKVLGSSRKHLIFQFITESVLVTFAAAIIALILGTALLPLFNQVSGKELLLSSHTFTWLLPLMLIAVLVIGVLAGSYPAFFLSAFQPIQVLKGKLSTGFNDSWMRSILVIFQFFISVFLIVGTLVIYKQLHYIQTKNLGYNRNQVLVVRHVFELGNQAKAFKHDVKQLRGVINATTTGFLPTSINRNTSIFYKEATPDQKNAIFPQVWYVDDDYISTLEMKMAAGRNFSDKMPTDSTGVIINETAARFLGYPEPLNKTLFKSEVDPQNHTNTRPYHIIGMVKDFHFNSLHQNIGPVALLLGDDNGDLSIRFDAASLPVLLAQIKSKWDKLSPGNFEYSFMDADFEASYRAEQRVGVLSVVFTTLAIFIACLGLFGLAAYAAEQRTREIGIRKVLGASVSAIVAMLSVDFIKLVLIALVIAAPFAWFCMHQWLQDFAYRVSISWWILTVAGLTALFIALVTIGTQALKAAVANPVDSLRNE